MTIGSISGALLAPFGATSFSPATDLGADAPMAPNENSIEEIARIAQHGLEGVTGALQADMTSGGGAIDAAKMQAYSMQIGMYDSMM